MKLLISLFVTFVIIAVVAVGGQKGDLPLDKLRFALPGTRVQLVARLKAARQIVLTEDESALFVGTSTEGDGSVYAIQLSTDPRTGHIVQAPGTEPIPVTYKMQWPNGVALDNSTGDLYVADIPNVWRVPDAAGSIKRGETKFKTPVLVRKYPSDEWHGWKYIRINKGRLYVPIGSPCNTCLKDLPYGTITSFNYSTTDASAQDFRIEAQGIRNTVGFDWHPVSGNLWFSDNGRDDFGEDKPGDELNEIVNGRANQHFGFPYCYNVDVADPEYNKDGDCRPFIPNAYTLGPHVAALGVHFYRGGMFPEAYKNTNVFIAEHGSWNRKIPLGYRITRVNTTDPSPNAYQVFVDGWLNLPSAGQVRIHERRVNDSEHAWGRPVSIIEMKDGSLLVSDDKAGAIYRFYFKQ